MKLNFFLAIRYLSGRKGKGVFSVFSIMTIIGIIVGVAALISVLSVMNGFQANVKDKIISLQSFHLSVEDLFGNPIEYASLVDDIRKVKYVEGVYPIIESPVLFNIAGTSRGAMLRGYPLDFFTSPTFKKQAKITDGNLVTDETDSFAYVGEEFSALYNAPVMKKLVVNVFTTSLLMPKVRVFTLKALYKTGYYPIDSAVIYTSLYNAQSLLSMEGKAQSLGIIVTDMSKLERVKADIEKIVGMKRYIVKAWYDHNRNFYAALKNELVLMFFIVFMIILVAAFNMISSQIMTVMNKQKEIGILKAIGFTPSDIRNIFILNGTIIGLMGTILGTIAGLAISRNIDSIFSFLEIFVNRFFDIAYFFIHIFNRGVLQPEFQIFSRDVYYLDKMPVNILFSDIMFINVMSMVLIFLSTLVPAHKAASVKPKEVIHNE